jgi:hypothetical protein
MPVKIGINYRSKVAWRTYDFISMVFRFITI